MKLAMKIAGALAILLVLAGGGFAGLALTRWDRTFEVPYPDIQASRDEAVIDHGRYLVYGPAHCAYCHTPREDWPALDAGGTPPLRGGHALTIPPGTFHVPNITPDAETGIGRRTDPELARLIRHQVRADGRVAVPFMEFQNLSDADLRAVISFLRSQEPVRNPVPEHQLNFLGKAVLATVIRPQGPSGTPPAEGPPIAPTVERGRYVAETAAQCAACHTKRSMVDGSYQGPLFAGGSEMSAEDGSPRVFVTPNLTPDAATGIIAGWTEDQFIARFRAGTRYIGTPMPWGAFARMHDDDLRAVYRYLTSLDPVVNDVRPIIREVR
jgi:mono/diheme cytochrome c family protein